MGTVMHSQSPRPRADEGEPGGPLVGLSGGSVKPADTEGEHCQTCGRAYPLGGWWSAPDDLWREVTGLGENGLRCPDCFGAEATAKGITLEWTARRADPGRCSKCQHIHPGTCDPFEGCELCSCKGEGFCRDCLVGDCYHSEVG